MSEAASSALVRRVVGVPDTENRDRNDYYPTPPEGTAALMRAERFEGDVWECACGAGHMARVVEDFGHRVIATDLFDYGFGISGVDFLQEEIARAPNVVTNPPFKHAGDFIRHAHRLTAGAPRGGKVAMLLRLAFLEGRRGEHLFDKLPFARLWVFRERLTIMRSGDAPSGVKGMIAFAWFVWDPRHRGRPTIGWI